MDKHAHNLRSRAAFFRNPDYKKKGFPFKYIEPLGAELEAAADEIDRLRGRVERLETRLVRCLPMCFVCPECGPFAEVDEADCCTSCGRDCEIKDSKDALEGEN